MHWAAVKRMLRYLKKTNDYKLVYSSTCLEEVFIMYSDADLGGDPEMARSITGFVITVGGGAVLWSSQLQCQVTLLLTEAEYTTAAATSYKIMCLRDFCNKVRYDMLASLTLYLDSASALQVTKNPEHHTMIKHMNCAYYWL